MNFHSLIAAGLIIAGSLALPACASMNNPSPQFSCSVVQTDSQDWQSNVTITGPTPDINGGPEIIHLIIGYYDASGNETGTGWGMNGLSGFSVAAGQTLTFNDVTDGTGTAPASCQVQSY